MSDAPSFLEQGGTPLVGRLLEVIEKEIVPLTELGVREGNKIFGAAILKKTDGNLVLAATNEETKCPLFHGEVSAIIKFYELRNEQRSSECIFVSTHEPCSLCLSAIAWSGFDNFFYLFDYERTRDDFSIPHDLRILEEVFRCEDGNYTADNAYWQGRSIASLIAPLGENERTEFERRVGALGLRYAALSRSYQDQRARLSEADATRIPLA